MQKQIQNTIEKVSNSFPSLFSKEDVIKLLTDLSAEMQSESSKPQINKERLVEIFEEVFRNKDFGDVVNTDDVELSLSCNNVIEVENIPVDEDFIVNSAVEALEASWDALVEVANED
jgi:hypothetical protein